MKIVNLEARCNDLNTFRQKIPQEEIDRNILDFKYQCRLSMGDECKYYGVYCCTEKVYFVCKNLKEDEQNDS